MRNHLFHAGRVVLTVATVFLVGCAAGVGGGLGEFAGSFVGGGQAPVAHSITIDIAENGNVTGQSSWTGTGNFTLTGSVDALGNITFQDDAPERLNNPGFNRGLYRGTVNAQTGLITGQYFESNNINVARTNWSAQRQ